MSVLAVSGTLAATELRRSPYYSASSAGYVSSNGYAPSSGGFYPSTSSNDGLQFSTVSAPAASSSMACSNSCSNYESILLGCQSDAGQENIYKSCVCNDPNFSSSVQDCISCEGTDSAPYQFYQNCKSVKPDCTVACSQFEMIVQSCDPGSSNYESCMCSSAYDAQYTTTFNQAFKTCATCEYGGGQAADWEARCCANGKGCLGISPQASREAATMPSSSSARPSATSSPSTGAAPRSETSLNVFGIGWIQLLIGVGAVHF